MVTLRLTVSAPNCPKLPHFLHCSPPFIASVTGEPRDFKFGTLTYYSKSHPADEKYSLKGAWSWSGEPLQNFTLRVISPQRLMLETSNFVHGSAMQSLSLVMSDCFLSGRGQGYVSNFDTVDLENFATASRQVNDTLPPTKLPTSYHRFGQDLSYK